MRVGQVAALQNGQRRGYQGVSQHGAGELLGQVGGQILPGRGPLDDLLS